ncbi:cytochrome P450 [Lasiosphaeria ovina]|uniref:Cytochrome P450 n=1 Tax=Lasiosphaeria ovina TaxID=92902 RepID=A0AAE0KAG4_9PEZI|nr:cytochrome P450 [Lasiosphaeria ovina]
MSLPNILASASAITLCGWLSILLVSWYVASAFASWHRLRHIPGPALASFSYLWMVWHTVRGSTRPAYTDLRKKYGPVVRVAPNYLLTSDADELRRIARVRSPYSRDPWYTALVFRPNQANLLNMLDNAEHDAFKARTASAYNGRENGGGADVEAAVDSQVVRLLALIRRKYLSTAGPGKEAGTETGGGVFRPVNFAPLSRHFAMDVITRLGYGKPFGHLDEGSDVYGWIDHVDASLVGMCLGCDIPLLRRIAFSPLGLRLFGPHPADKRGVGKVMGVINNIIAQRFARGDKQTSDAIGGFMRHGLTQEQCEAEAMLQIGGGSDTTATAIRGVMMHLMASPQAYGRLKREIADAVARNPSLSSGADAVIALEQAQKLPYLQAVVSEGFRLRNPVNYGHFKRVPAGGDTIGGLFVPGGTAIGHNVLALTRDEAVFGSDAHVFRPERFLECAPEEKVKMTRALDILWGGGRWTCAGRGIAVMEINKVVFELMRAFDLSLVNPTQPWDETMLCVTMHKNMWVRITEAEKV